MSQQESKGFYKLSWLQRIGFGAGDLVGEDTIAYTLTRAAGDNAGTYEISTSITNDNYDVTVVTQNVDNLHEMAGSTKVIHLHGELMKVCSSYNVDDPRYQIQLTPENCEVEPGTKAGDGSLLRPFIVFFGEAVPNITVAAEEVQQADILIIIGTSLVVYPAAGLMHYAKPDAPIYLIDPNPINAGSRVFQIQKGASEGMKELMKILEK